MAIPDKGATQTALVQQLTLLAATYGQTEAKQLWEAAVTQAFPKPKGRPPGALNKEASFNAKDAHAILHTLAKAPQNLELSRWQLVRWTAELLDDQQPRLRRSRQA